MFRKLVVVAASVVLMPLTTASAQAIDPFPADGIAACILAPSIFSAPIAPTKCVGFFDKNTNQFGTNAAILNSGNTVEAWMAMNLMGIDMTSTYFVKEKISSWNGSDAFGTTMIGWTVLGIHWGNYPGAVAGNVSAYYLFDAGAGTNVASLIDVGGVSNAAILYTDGGQTRIVPEPSSYALLGAGLLALGFVSRRRRTS